MVRRKTLRRLRKEYQEQAENAAAKLARAIRDYQPKGVPAPTTRVREKDVIDAGQLGRGGRGGRGAMNTDTRAEAEGTPYVVPTPRKPYMYSSRADTIFDYRTGRGHFFLRE